MKKTIITITCLVMLAVSSFANMPNEKVLKSFEATFASAEQIAWHENPKYYDVDFIQNGIRSNVKYDKEGNFLSSIRYYGAEILPVNIFCQLRKKYPRKKVYLVTELTNVDEVNYYIKLEDEKTWFTIKATGNGTMDCIEKLKKA